GRPATLQSIRYFRLGLDLPDALTHAALTTLGGHVYVISPEGIWAYVPEHDRFEAVTELRGYGGITAAVEPSPASTFWMVKRKETGAATMPALIRVTASERPTAVATEFFAVPGLESAGQISALSAATGDRGPALWIGGSRALLKIDPDRLERAAEPARALIRRVEKNGSELASLAPASPVTFAANTERLLFEFSSADAASGQPVAYQTRLLPVDSQWSAPQRDRRRTFTGLAARAYVFQVRTMDQLGRAGDATVYPFTLLAPWYERTSTLAGGAAALLLLLLL